MLRTNNQMKRMNRYAKECELVIVSKNKLLTFLLNIINHTITIQRKKLRKRTTKMIVFSFFAGYKDDR
jgi:hypothetical protein